MGKPNLLNMLKGDGTDAAYRVGANQMTKGLQTALVKVVESQGGSSDTVKATAEILNSEAGKSLVGYLSGIALTYAPVISEDPRAKRLAEEFRVGGMTTAGNAIIDNLMANVLPILKETLGALPGAEEIEEADRVRVAELSEGINISDEEKQPVRTSAK